MTLLSDSVNGPKRIWITSNEYRMEALRQLVSGKKRRLVTEEYNLDLTYITPRLIAMSFPGEGFEKLFRNSGDSVARYLNEQHPGCYRSFNLSGDRYNYEKFGNSVVDFPWPDHHAPPLDLLFHACALMSEWLLSDIRNVAVVHCKAGKGRTGTLICCYLLFCGRVGCAEEAMKVYRVQRFSEGGGVTQPSQKRYIHYFEQVLKGRVRQPLRLLFSKVILKTAPHMSSDTSRPYLKIYSGSNLVFSSKASSRDLQPQFSDNWEENRMHYILIPNGVILAGDVLCKLQHWGVFGTSTICRFSFHTSFMPEGNVLPLSKAELDPDSFYKSNKVADQFTVFLVFQDCCDCLIDAKIEDKCETCQNELLLEVQKWREIAHILDSTESVRNRETGSLSLFGEYRDNLEEVLRTAEGASNLS